MLSARRLSFNVETFTASSSLYITANGKILKYLMITSARKHNKAVTSCNSLMDGTKINASTDSIQKRFKRARNLNLMQVLSRNFCGLKVDHQMAKTNEKT